MIPFRRAFLTLPLGKPFVALQRRPIFPNVRFYSASLPLTEYHRVADETMDKLTAELENLLEENDIPGSDVEYSVLSFFNRICLYARVG
jgi:hypothetical protein